MKQVMDAIKATAKGDAAHAEILVRMHLGAMATDANVAIVMAAMKAMK